MMSSIPPKSPAYSVNPRGRLLQAPAAPQKQPKFGGYLQGIQNNLDFKQLGASHVEQIKLIYAACILWRLIAANERRKESPNKSFNEIRESLLRDSVGYIFWFFAVPAIQRAYLGRVPKEFRASLIQDSPETGGGFKNALKWLNPLSKNIPTSEQVKEQMEQALLALKQKGIKPEDKAFQQTKKFYSELLKYRNKATGIGLVLTIGLLGVCINLLNFYLTRRNMERQKAALQQQKAVAPSPSIPPRFFGPAMPLQSTAFHGANLRTPSAFPQRQSW